MYDEISGLSLRQHEQSNIDFLLFHDYNKTYRKYDHLENTEIPMF